MEKKVMTNKPLWSALPEELLGQILGKLYAPDQLRFHAVCKNWFAIVPYMKKLSNSLPWFVMVDYSSECQYFDMPLSSHLNPFFIQKLDLKSFSTLAQYSVQCIYVTCKYDWLFFSIQNQDFSPVELFIFSPVTQETIKLPTLVHSKNHPSGWILKAISAEPDSPDCVFLVFDQHHSVITISTIGHGDKEWTTREFDNKTGRYFYFTTTPVYIGGTFYFISSYGDVGSYKLISKEWKVEKFLIDKKCEEISKYSSCNICTTELNGELVLLYCYEKTSCIRMLDWGNKVWVPLTTLWDQALFVSRNSFSVSTFGKEARDNGILSNKIYWLGESGCTIYSLENGDLVTSAITYWDTKYLYLKRLTSWMEPPNYLLNPKQTRTKVGWSRPIRVTAQHSGTKEGQGCDNQ